VEGSRLTLVAFDSESGSEQHSIEHCRNEVALADDPHGKLLWDVVAGELAGQAADQSSLTGRAKDLLGVATISTTITGVILNNTLFNFDKEEVPLWWIGVAAASLIAIFGAGLWAILPRIYSFAPDASHFHQVEEGFPGASEGELYRAMAEGYLLPDPKTGKNQLERNRKEIRFIDTLVSIQMVGVAALTAMAFVLAFLIGR
jgi:hypothetical protein